MTDGDSSYSLIMPDQGENSMFRLKTAALAATMAAAALSAQASDVEVFGRLDTGVLYTVNQGDAKDTRYLSRYFKKIG